MYRVGDGDGCIVGEWVGDSVGGRVRKSPPWRDDPTVSPITMAPITMKSKPIKPNRTNRVFRVETSYRRSYEYHSFITKVTVCLFGCTWFDFHGYCCHCDWTCDVGVIVASRRGFPNSTANYITHRLPNNATIAVANTVHYTGIHGIVRFHWSERYRRWLPNHCWGR